MAGSRYLRGGGGTAKLDRPVPDEKGVALMPLDPRRVRVGVLAAQLCARIPGGTGRYTRELLTALAETAGPDDEPYALALQRCAGLDDLPVRIDRIPRIPGISLPRPVLSRLWERGLPPVLRGAIVHAPTLLVPPVRGDTRLVVTVHDVVPWTHPEALTERGVAFHRRMGHRAAREADLIVTPTQAVARAVRATLEPQGEVVAVPLGVSTLSVPADAVARQGAMGVAGPYVLFVGTAEPRKGLDVLIRAMGTTMARDLSLVVAGPPGWGGVDVAELASTAGIAHRVRVTGRVSDPDLAALYSGASVVAMPSRAEGFGLPVVEAMSLGVPVVTSDDPALLEVGGGAALSAPIGDESSLAAALAEASSPGPARERMRAAGPKRAATFSWDAAAHRMWELYSRLA